MNEALYLFVIPVVLFALAWFTPQIRRHALAFGDKVTTRVARVYGDRKLPAALAALGETLVLEADQAAATRVVEAAVATRPKRYRVTGPGTYTAKFVEHGDVHVRLVVAGSGSQLQLQSFRDYLGFPQGHREWDDLRERVTVGAARAGVPVRAGESVAFERREQVRPDNWRWVRVEAT